MAQGFDFFTRHVDVFFLFHGFDGGLAGHRFAGGLVFARPLVWLGLRHFDLLGIEVFFIDQHLFFLPGFLVGVAGAYGGVGVGGGVGEAVAVARSTGDGLFLYRLPACDFGLSGADKQQAAVFDGGDGVVLFGQPCEKGGVRFVGLVDMGDFLVLISGADAVRIAVGFGDGFDDFVKRGFVPALFLLFGQRFG